MITRFFGLLSLVLCLTLGACGGSGNGTDPESVLVDRMTAVAAPLDDRVAVSLEHHADIYLDMTQANATARAEILESMRGLGAPMYFEIDPGTRLIQRYLFVTEGQVVELVPQDDGTAIHLTTSAAVHFLLDSHPKYKAFLSLLEQARDDATDILVTTDMDHGQTVVDVREPLAP